MNSPFPIGPAGNAEWENEIAGGEETYPQAVLLLPDAGNPSMQYTDVQPVFYTLPSAPSVMRNPAGKYIFSLVVVLSRMPAPDDETIYPLVERGQLSFTLGLGIPSERMLQLAYSFQDSDEQTVYANASFRPLFARAIRAAVEDLSGQQPEMLASTTGMGADAQLAFSASLDRTQTLQVLDALNGVVTELHMVVEIDYRAVIVNDSETDTDEPESLRKPRLRCGPPSAYNTTVIVEEQVPTEILQTITLKASLTNLFADILADGETDRYLRLLAMPKDAVELREVPARVRAKAPRSTPNEVKRPVPLMVYDQEAVAISTLLKPNSLTLQTAQFHLADHQPALTLQPELTHWAAQDLHILYPQPSTHLERLPVVDNPDSPLWLDRVQADEFWYAPQFTLVSPAANTTAANSPYCFSFVRAGHTSSGKPGLEGTIQFTLQQTISAATQEALNQNGNPPAKPVEILDLVVYFLLPFRDDNGKTRTERFIATLKPTGDSLVAEIQLTDNWVRLAYGALAIEGYQTQPAQVVVSYCYRAYSVVKRAAVELRSVPKDGSIPIQKKKGKRSDAVPRTPYFDTQRLVYHHPQADIHYLTEPGDRLPLPIDEPIRPALLPLIIRPELTPLVIDELQLIPDQTLIYSVQTYGVNQALPILYPCNQFGALYEDRSSETAMIVGCQEAFELGQTRYRQYERMEDADLQNDVCTIYRSLQQVGLFLIVPRRYCITRFASDEGERAYRPIIYLYSVADSNTPNSSRCDFAMTLQPDVPLHVEQDLLARLATRAASPILRYVTEIESDITYEWSIAEAGSFTITPQVVAAWDSFQVTLSTNLMGTLQVQAMLQRTGLSGLVKFRLPDDSLLQTNLRLDLNEIVGPFREGPLSVVREDSTVRLKNEIERIINITDLAVFEALNRVNTLPVDIQLAPDASHTVTLPTAINAQAGLLPVYALAPGDAATLAEIRSFIEDIRINVIFINLIDLDARGLSALRLEAQIQNIATLYPLELTSEIPTDEISVVLSLTEFLQHQILNIRVGKVVIENDDETVSWVSLPRWSLATAGHVISLTWEMLETANP
jgi:hypothetical protein